jgi:RimJ/RimL family protein N-acetyltransferase
MSEQVHQSEPAGAEADAVGEFAIKKLTTGDAEQLLKLLESNRVALERFHIYCPENLEEVLDKLSPFVIPPGRIDFGVWATGELVGEVDLIPQGPTRAEIIYWIDEEHQSHGYGGRAIQSLVDYATKSRDIKTFRAWVDHENEPSKRTLEKVGFCRVADNKATTSTCYELSMAPSGQ